MIDVKKISLSNQVFEKLEEDILNGFYSQGSIITLEKAASNLSVSTATAKEALIRLESERLVESVEDGFKVLGITENDIKDIFNVKRLIEIQAAGLAANNMKDDDIGELENLVKEQEAAVSQENSERVRNFDTKFHDKIYSCCGSATFELILSPVHHKLSKYRKVSLDNKERVKNSVKEHRKILEAIMKHSGPEAEAAMMEHIENSYMSISEISERK